MLSRRARSWQPPQTLLPLEQAARGRMGAGREPLPQPSPRGRGETALTAWRRKTSAASPPPRSRGRRHRPRAHGGRSAGGRSAGRCRPRRPWGPGRRNRGGEAGERDRAGAHRARLERDVEVAADQPFGAKLRRGLADHEHFGMGGRIGELARAIAGARDHRSGANERGADRRLAARFGRPRLGEGEAHRIAVPVALVARHDDGSAPASPRSAAKRRFSLAAGRVRA